MSRREMTNVPHTCPRCNGQGHTWTPPWVAGDQATFMTADLRTYPCRPCSGTGIVWTSQASVLDVGDRA